MRHRALTAALALAVAAGCGRQKSTDELVGDLKSQSEHERISAARILGSRKGDADKTIPALIDSLHDADPGVRRSAAIGLGGYGPEAAGAIPALEAALKDRDVRVHEAAAAALHRIDPAQFAQPAVPRPRAR